ATGIAMLTMDIFGADRWAALSRLTRPTLVVATSESRLLDLQRDMDHQIPGAQLVEIADAAHAVFVDQPEPFNDALERFLAGLDQGPGRPWPGAGAAGRPAPTRYGGAECPLPPREGGEGGGGDGGGDPMDAGKLRDTPRLQGRWSVAPGMRVRFFNTA